MYRNFAVMDNGGGLAADTSAQLVIKNSQFYENSAINSGGGLYLFDGIQLRLNQSTIMSNTAKTERGGGIYIRQNVDAQIENSTISGNKADGVSGTTNDNGNGGGLYIGAVEVPSMVTVTQSTITDNYAAGEGGGMDFNRFDPGDVLTFQGTILAGNSAGGTHQDCYDYDTNNYTFNTDAYNLFSGSANDDCPVVGSDLSLADLGVVITDVIARNLADNGGDTLTHALVEGSPAINVIPENDCFVAIDQRIVSRPQFLFCDIGSVEDEGKPVYLPIIIK